MPPGSQKGPVGDGSEGSLGERIFANPKTTEIAFEKGERRRDDMNTEKWRTGNLGLLAEADRTMYDKKDVVSKSIIDPDRTHLNYNMCPHEQYTAAQVKDINRKIRGKELAKNAIAWGGTVVSVPKDYTGDTDAFFRTAYKGLKAMYKLRDEDIISAYVHLDETTPHMHFYFIPVHHDREKGDCVNWNKVMPRSMYKTQHQKLQKYMEDNLHTPVNLINGETKGVDLQGMTADERRLSMRVSQLRKDVSKLRKRETTLANSVAALEAASNKLMAGIDAMVKAHDGLRRVLNRPWVQSRDKIEVIQDKTDVRTEQALEHLDDVDAILAAASATERAARTYTALKAAAKGEVDIDDLLEDGWER